VTPGYGFPRSGALRSFDILFHLHLHRKSKRVQVQGKGNCALICGCWRPFGPFDFAQGKTFRSGQALEFGALGVALAFPPPDGNRPGCVDTLKRHYFRLCSLCFGSGGRRRGRRHDAPVSAMWKADPSARDSHPSASFNKDGSSSRGYQTAVKRKRIAAHRDHRLHQSTQHPAASLAIAPANAERAPERTRVRAARNEVRGGTTSVSSHKLMGRDKAHPSTPSQEWPLSCRRAIRPDSRNVKQQVAA